MREFAKLPPPLYRDEKFARLKDREKLGYVYAISSPHSNRSGCYSLPAAYMADDLRWPVAQVRKVLAALVACGLIVFDEATDEILIVDWFGWNGPDNPSDRKGLLRHIDRIRSPTLQAQCRRAADAAWQRKSETTAANGSLEAVRQRYAKQPAQPHLLMPVDGGKATAQK